MTALRNHISISPIEPAFFTADAAIISTITITTGITTR
jgi:hypothetical protein